MTEPYISFPRLNWTFNIDRVAFEVFGISIYWYGIIIALGFLLAVVLGMRRSKKEGIEPENVIDLVLIAVPVSIVLARLYYVVFNWDVFSGNILSIFNTRLGGLAIYGGIIGAFLSAYIFAKWKKISILKLLDFGVPYLVMAQGIGRWGNFVNQEAFGTNTTLPWGMTGNEIQKQLSFYQMQGMDVTPDLPVHPTFLYESLLNISIFLFLIWFRNRKKKDGEVLYLYMILYGVGRFFVEGLRTDSLMLGAFRVSKVLAMILAVTFALVFIISRMKASKKEDENVELGSSSYGTVLKKLEEDAAADNTEVQEKEVEDNDSAISSEEASNGEIIGDKPVDAEENNVENEKKSD